MGETLLGRESSPVMWEGPPTDKIERSGRVKGKQGKGLGEKKGRREGKLHNCKSTPVHPVSAMRGEGGEGAGVERELLEKEALTGAGVFVLSC